MNAPYRSVWTRSTFCSFRVGTQPPVALNPYPRPRTLLSTDEPTKISWDRTLCSAVAFELSMNFCCYLSAKKTKLWTQFSIHSPILPFLAKKADPALILGWNHIFSLEMKLCILNVVIHTQLFSKMLEKQCIWIAHKEKSTVRKMTANHLQLLWPKIFKQFKLL